MPAPDFQRRADSPFKKRFVRFDPLRRKDPDMDFGF
jgi:hypothetical protein